MIKRMSNKVSAGVLVLVLGVCFRLQAMDRWAALSQIESGDNDRAVGRQGEVSRFQILPEVWRRYAPQRANCRRPDDALSVAKVAMRERCDAFERRFHRSPNDLEFYVLWNAPSQLPRPSKTVFQRAQRFQNLVTPDFPTREAGLNRRSVWPPTS
jgi:hypothetical protein